jgi:hypothetical protein
VFWTDQYYGELEYCIKMVPSEDRAAVLVTLPAASLRLPAEPGGECGRVAVGMAHQGYDLQLTRRARLGRDVLHDGDGALADERDRHRVGTYAVACDATGGVGGVEEGGNGLTMKRGQRGGL